MTKPTKWHVRPAKTQIEPGHPPSLIRIFAVRMKKAWVLSYPLRAQRRLWSDWPDAQADLSLRWAHMPFCWFCHEAAQIIIWARAQQNLQNHMCFLQRLKSGWAAAQFVLVAKNRELLRAYREDWSECAAALRIFAGHTFDFVDSVVLWLIWSWLHCCELNFSLMCIQSATLAIHT